MSFITKRERVFNEYDLFDLPARNEGKLKAYSSCTDARAWSHFCSDKTEHLVEIIKRNNETVRPKYVPTDVIVNTLMTSKNAEIARLKRKIGEFEQMLAAYDELDLTCDQKCEIANAHAAIKAANKELDDMFLDLNLSDFTEGIDSEAFETGKSRGDEPSRYIDETGKSRGDEWTMGKASTPRMQTKSNQIGTSCKCDASTSAHDERIDELKETIISKDAKLSAMQNTIAVMENDVCEPYCIYAHIYTALEKIFGTLCQNEKYKQYLDLLTAGKDTRGIDLKGKIIFKMKILEKFSLALIAPCSQNLEQQDCSCYRAEVVTRVETTFALTSAESKVPNLDVDNKRAQLVADIMQNDDMKEILSKESLCTKFQDDQIDDYYQSENYDTEAQNLKRLKNLQANYHELLNCYDNLKHERDSLNIRCLKYLELENECECLQNKLREYNQLWKEKEFYRKRSEDLNALKESYYVLSEETASIETKLKAEQEINKVKSGTIDELRNENIKLENKISEISLSFEKQRNILICKLKESECKIVCQEQQIKSLTNQVESILKADNEKILQNEDDDRSVELLDEINTQKEQIKNLKDALCCNEEEKQYFQEELERKHEIINDLKIEIENWKRKYEETNEYLGSYLEKCQIEINELQVNSNSAIENLNHIIESKSQEISYLIDEVDRKNFENKNLAEQMNNLQDDFKTKVTALESEKQIALSSIHTVKKESLEILENIKNYDNHRDNSSYESININYQGKNENLTKEVIQKLHSNDVNFLNEIELLHEINLESVQLLQNENIQLKKSFEAANREVERLKRELTMHEDVNEKFKKLKDSHESLLNENKRLLIDLNNKTSELDNIKHAFQLSKKESETLIDELHKTECIQEEYIKLNESYQKVISDRNVIQNKLLQAEKELKELQQCQKTLRENNEVLLLKVQEQQNLEKKISAIKKSYEKLKEEDDILKNDYSNKVNEINDLCKCLTSKDDEIRDLYLKVKKLEDIERLASNKINSLNTENINMLLNINTMNENVLELENKLKYYENLENNFNNLKHDLDKLKLEKEILQKDLQMQIERMAKLQQENCNLNDESKTLLRHSEDLENALLHARDESLSQTNSINVCYNDMKKEIDILRKEKMSYHKKIGDLLDKLEEAEFRRIELDEMIVSKDKKIFTLENHINELEDEIRRLQYSLNEVIETGEQIKQRSYEKIEQFKTIEAHHSKAIHNMKIEQIKQQNENENLEKQLSSNKLITEETYQNKNDLFIQIKELLKERLEIVTQIKQLELNSVGESNLFPENCTVNDVILSLHRINKFVDEKNKCLENTLTNVQASYQLLKSKADEAKKIAEDERQKIINEKFEIQRERKIIEEQLENLINENRSYEKDLQDLKREIMNQELIFNRQKQLSENDIVKLKEENISLQKIYDNSLNTIKKLQEKLDAELKDKNLYFDEIEKLKLFTEDKTKAIAELQNHIEMIENKPTQNFSVQTVLLSTNKDVEIQTDTQDEYNYFIHNNSITTSKSAENTSELLKPLNTKIVEPTLDFIKHTYINCKIKELSMGRLEHYSITDFRLTSDDYSERKLFENDFYVTSPLSDNMNLSLRNGNIIDIRSTQTRTNFTKNLSDNDNYTSKNNTESLKSQSVISREKQKKIRSLKTNSALNGTISSTENDMFLIYKDSKSTYDDQTNTEDKSWPQNGINVIVERATIYTKENLLPKRQKSIQNINEQSDYEENDDDSLRPKLNINMPRVYTKLSATALSDEDIMSLDSINQTFYNSPKLETFSDTNIFSNNSNKINKPKYNTTNHNVNIDKKLKVHHNAIFNDSKTHSKQRNQNIRENKWSHSSINVNNKQSLRTHSPEESNLSRTNANIAVVQNFQYENTSELNHKKNNYGLNYILNSIQNNEDLNDQQKVKPTNLTPLRKCRSEKKFSDFSSVSQQSEKTSSLTNVPTEYLTPNYMSKPTKSVTNRGVLVKLDISEDYENKIQQLTNALENMEKDYKNKLETIKIQYESNINYIVNEHNQGVKSIQNLHEDYIREIINKHENEVESLRTMSIEAMRKAEKLENENRRFKSRLSNNDNIILDEVPVKIHTLEGKKKRNKTRQDSKVLTKTIVDAFNVKPKRRSHGPCTCSIDINISDTIRNIFEKVDVEQRQIAEMAYLKYIASKICNDNVDVLDAQELSFLHLKVCRTWKAILNKEESLQKKINSLESEIINKQRQTQKNISDLDRKVAEEWRRLQEVREAVCRDHRSPSRESSPEELILNAVQPLEKDACHCNPISCDIAVKEIRYAGDLESKPMCESKPKRGKSESNRATLAKLDIDQRRERKFFNDETPTRLKRSHDRQYTRTNKK